MFSTLQTWSYKSLTESPYTILSTETNSSKLFIRTNFSTRTAFDQRRILGCLSYVHFHCEWTTEARAVIFPFLIYIYILLPVLFTCVISSHRTARTRRYRLFLLNRSMDADSPGMLTSCSRMLRLLVEGEPVLLLQDLCCCSICKKNSLGFSLLQGLLFREQGNTGWTCRGRCCDSHGRRRRKRRDLHWHGCRRHEERRYYPGWFSRWEKWVRINLTPWDSDVGVDTDFLRWGKEIPQI